jgi:hypothetical protein
MVASWKHQPEQEAAVTVVIDLISWKNQATTLIEQRKAVNCNCHEEKSTHQVFADWVIGICFCQNFAETSKERLRMLQMRHSPLSNFTNKRRRTGDSD